MLCLAILCVVVSIKDTLGEGKGVFLSSRSLSKFQEALHHCQCEYVLLSGPGRCRSLPARIKLSYVYLQEQLSHGLSVAAAKKNSRLCENHECAQKKVGKQSAVFVIGIQENSPLLSQSPKDM